MIYQPLTSLWKDSGPLFFTVLHKFIEVCSICLCTALWAQHVSQAEVWTVAAPRFFSLSAFLRSAIAWDHCPAVCPAVWPTVGMTLHCGQITSKDCFLLFNATSINKTSTKIGFVFFHVCPSQNNSEPSGSCTSIIHLVLIPRAFVLCSVKTRRRWKRWLRTKQNKVLKRRSCGT